ncbi:MAG: ADP-ribosylglycohydrolase family protein, partial [Myxococcaceae bacterium]
MPPSQAILQDRYTAAVLGMAIGDALGFPLRGVPPKAIARLPDLAEDFSPRPRARFQKGQFSDDTQLMLAVAESVAREGRIEGRSVASHFAWLLREGVLLQPPRVLTEAIDRLLEGVPWMSAGAPIGNTDASCLSRALIAGLWHHDDPSKLAHEAGVLAVVTHKEPRCAAAAAAYARAVSLGFSADRLTPHDFCEELARAAAVHDEAFAEELRHLPRVLSWEEDRALELLRRVAVPSAELNHTDGLPAHVSPVLLTALYAALKVPHDFRLAMRLLLRAGGEI